MTLFPTQRRPFLTVLAAAALAAALPAAQAQQDYPNRTIKLIVDGAAGGVNDIWARRWAQRMGESLKQTVVVENRTGASGTLAVDALVKSPADGYTFFYGGLNPLVLYPGAGGQVRYDPVKDVTPIAPATMGYPMLVAGAGFGAKTVAEAVAKAAGKELTCGTGGQASLQHFACAQFAKAAKIKLLTVPYKGGVLAATDAAGGQLDFSIGYYSEVDPLVSSGKLVPLAVFGPQRLPRYPNVPTMAEAGLPGLELYGFSGFHLPAGAPAAVVARLNTEITAAMKRPEMAEWLKSAGGLYQPMAPDVFADFYRKEVAKWKKLSNDHGIKVEQ